MKKFIASLTKGKEKLAMDEWKTDYSVILWALHSVHKKNLFRYLLTSLNNGSSVLLKVIDIWKSS